MDAQVVLISSPGLGHLIPVIELGRRFLIHHNFKVTILAVTSSHSSGAEAQVLHSAATPNDDDNINTIQIPSPDISSLIDDQATACTRLCTMMRAAIPAIRHALSSIITHPSTLIVDMFGTEYLPLAQEFNMLNNYVFIASHAWCLSLLIYTPYLDKQVKGQYVDQKEPLKIPGCRPVRPEDVIDPMLDRNDKQYEEFLEIGNRIPKGDGVLVNTWECLQPLALGSLRDEDLLGRILKGPVYCVGPLVRQPKSETRQGTTESRVVKWMDKQPSESVIYVSFGSGGTMSYEQTTELAWGLELSGQRFVWVVRPPSVGPADSAFFSTGSGDTSDEEMEQMSKYLPKGFLSRTLNVGFIVSQWAPQVVILRHPCVGGFLSHCGWNSTLESLTNGVPMIAWPLYAEQRMNATMLAEELGVAVRPEVLPAKKVVGREEIASMVKRIMVVDDNDENPIRERVKEIKHGAVEALSKGGSSIAALSQVAKTIVINAE